MPEGDTIHRAARTLQAALGGCIVTSFETVLPALARIDDESPLRGRRIERVFAEGKHLLIEFSGDLMMRSHMRMNGSWHIYRAGERWQRPRSDMRVVIATKDWVAVGFNLPVAEFFSASSLARHDELRRLGPDLAGVDFDAADAVRRARARPDVDVAELLLDQRVAAGIGNVYKSEVLFIRKINPFVKGSALTDEELDGLYATARKLLVHNVERTDGSRETRSGISQDERLWVYGRRGQPCRRCGTPIEMKQQGRDARVTYWCPKCQS